VRGTRIPPRIGCTKVNEDFPQATKIQAQGVMYQLEVKRWLVTYRYLPADGWAVTVDVDAMERDAVGKHKSGKREIATECEAWLRANGVNIVAHELFGRADLVASKPGVGTVVVEVEGDSSRQREQALYSALGQLLVSMAHDDGKIRYALAVPDDADWESHLNKVPQWVCENLRLDLLLVSVTGVREMRTSIPQRLDKPRQE
jgi:hypothetical protein